MSKNLDIDLFKNEIRTICSDLYGETSNPSYFMVPNSRVVDVELSILNALTSGETNKVRYLNICTSIFQVGNNVAIKID